MICLKQHGICVKEDVVCKKECVMHLPKEDIYLFHFVFVLLKKKVLKLSTEDSLILAGAKLNPDIDDIKQMDELFHLVKDWEYFSEQAIHNGLGPIIYKNLLKNNFTENIPPEEFSKLKQSYYRSLSRNIALYDHFKNVINAINANGIEVIALKGIYLAEAMYKDIGLRQMTDVDLLVKKEDAVKCQDILIDIGYASTRLDTASFMKDLLYFKHLPSLVKGGLSVELHTQVHIEYTELVVDVNDYWNRSIKAQIAGVEVLVLSNEDLLQHICLHLDEHFDDGKPQLYSLMDIATLISTLKIDWDVLIDSSKKYNCSNRIFRQLFLAHKYFNAGIPDKVLSVIKPYFDDRIDRLFIHYLQQHRKNVPIGTTNRNIELMKNRKGFRNKCLYIFHDLFPSRSFMYKRYRIERKYFLVFFYIYRLLTGTYKLILEFYRSLIPSAKSKN